MAEPGYGDWVEAQRELLHRWAALMEATWRALEPQIRALAVEVQAKHRLPEVMADQFATLLGQFHSLGTTHAQKVALDAMARIAAGGGGPQLLDLPTGYEN